MPARPIININLARRYVVLSSKIDVCIDNSQSLFALTKEEFYIVYKYQLDPEIFLL
ncbi:hypothetical protein RINTHM_8110 [Richelia intracellularis HM01]|nr:hypothetical protein RINTHM_8110 [Richelia intracellularis HM01]